MAEEGKESGFVCKLCCKKFPCGKSLGGHMRSHVVDERASLMMRKNLFLSESKFPESGNGQNGYGLRENPKKTWRAVDSRLPLPQEKVCKQCGKGFQSLKALCGHMACHSDKDKGPATKDDHDHDHSWTSDNQKMVLDSQSDTETEEKRLRTRSFKSRKCKKIAEDSPYVLASTGGSSVSEIDGQEQEELAKCLMMLSRDSGSKGGVNSVIESSDNNSVVMETKSSSIEMKIGRKVRVGQMMLPEKKNEPIKLGDVSLDGETAKMEDSDSGYFLDECGKGDSDVSVGWFRKYGSKQSMDDDGIVASKCGVTESRKRKKHGYENHESWNESARMVKDNQKSKYECYNCKKVFKSYQALGGHKPCNKRICDESGENSPDDDAAYYRNNTKFVESSSKRKVSDKYSSEKKSKNMKNKSHVCPFCDRVFKNGQALGGHKRSHFLPGHAESINRRGSVEKPELSDLLDLNLPAPEADEEDVGGSHFFSW